MTNTEIQKDNLSEEAKKSSLVEAIDNADTSCETGNSENDKESEEVCNKNCSCCNRTKMRSEKEYSCLINRLSRIEGQVRGLKKMVENNAYCTDILVQVTAVNSALNSFSRELLTNHIRTCVADDIRNGHDEVIDDLVKTLQKLMK